MLIKSLLPLLLMTFSFNLYCVKAPTDLSNYKTSLGMELNNTYLADGNISQNIKDYVINFTVSRDCLKELQKNKNYQQNCMNKKELAFRVVTQPTVKVVPSNSESSNQTISDICYIYGCMGANETLNDKRIEHRKNAENNLKELEKLVKKGEIAESKYSVADFKLVIETLTNKNETFRDKQLNITKRPTFPTSLLFPSDQKENIVKALFQKENNLKNRYEKIKELISLAQKTDSKLTNYKNVSQQSDTDDNSSDLYNYVSDKDTNFYKKDEIISIEEDILSLVDRINELEEQIQYVKNSGDKDFIALLPSLQEDLNELNEEKDKAEKEIQELENITEEQLKERIRITQMILTARVETKGKIVCPNILHLAVENKDLDVVKFIIKNYQTEFAIKTAEKQKTDRKLVKYLNQHTYDAQKLSEAQNEYTRDYKRKHGKNPPEMGACFSVTTNDTLSKFKEFLGRNGVIDLKKAHEKLRISNALKSTDKYSTLEIAYLFWRDNPVNVKATFDIILELIQNGSSYREDLNLVYGNKADRNQLENKLPKHHTTIFDDFLMIGGGLEQYQKEKKDILDALTTGKYITRAQKREVKERYESLLNQAIENKSTYWCQEVLEVAKNDDGTYEAYLPYSSVYENRRNSDQDERKINRAKRFATLLANFDKKDKSHYYGVMNRKINRIEKTLLEAASGTPCNNIIFEAYEKFIEAMNKYLYKDFNAWHNNSQVYSIIHHKSFGRDILKGAKQQTIDASNNYKNWRENQCSSKIFDQQINKLFEDRNNLAWIMQRYPQLDPAALGLNDEDLKFLKMTREDFKWHRAIREAMLDFIVTAKDAYGNTPWDYGSKKGIWSSYQGDKKNIREVKEFLKNLHCLR